MQARVTKNEEQPPILLCCAGPDRTSIAPVVEKASHLGRAWLVCGVELNTKRLERGIERYGTTALYVLCRSTHLDGSKVGALQRLLRARGIPAARIMVVDVKAGQTGRVEGALEQRLATSPAPKTKLGGAIPPPPKVARSVTAAPARPKLAIENKVRKSRGATAKMAPVPAMKANEPAPDLGMAVRSPRPLAKVTLVAKGAPLPSVRAPRALSTASAPSPEPVAPAPVATAPEPKAETRQKTDSIPVAPSEPEPLAARSMIAALPRRKAPRWLLVSAAAAVVIGLGGMGVALAGAEDQAAAAPTDGAVANRDVEPAEQAMPTAPAPEAPTPPQAQAPAPVVGAAAAAAAAAAAPTAEPEAAAEPERAEPENDYELEIQGLRTRELREVDGIVFTAQVLDRDIHFLRAEAYCRNLTLSGISDWRLPTAAELGTIGGVVDVGRRPLWTNTEGDAKATAMLVYRGRQDEYAVHGRTWRGARALCVRASGDA